MNQVSFDQLNLAPEIFRAVQEMGFETATEIQSQSIPLLQSGCDVIGRSQTGTGKTLAFGIPAIQGIDTQEEKPHVQALILCPTRELAMQACEELKKLSAFLPGIRIVDVYGGAAMDRQIAQLKRANIVVGTPGRVMDHMRRRTLRLDHLKLIVLDEADEMLSMGFREDIETILKDTPEDRQTVLFSATMPPDILALTEQYQKAPQLVEIAKKQATVENIRQIYYEVPMGRKMDALNLILKYHAPRLAMIFCNTKSMVDDITEYLLKKGFDVEGLHGDMKQSQRTRVMDSFKFGKTNILVATDVAARGIDVNDVDYVINYDIPQNSEYYVHRIGRTGRAGKSGTAVTFCSGRRQVSQLLMFARFTRSNLQKAALPTAQEVRAQAEERSMLRLEQYLSEERELCYSGMVERLNEKGYAPELVAAALMELHFGRPQEEVAELGQERPKQRGDGEQMSYAKMVLHIGRTSRVAPNHIVAAVSERTELTGKEVGKIEIYDDYTVVGVPRDSLGAVVDTMDGTKICGKPTHAAVYQPHGPAFGGNRRRDPRRPESRKRAPERDWKKEGPVKDYRSLEPKKKRYHKA